MQRRTTLLLVFCVALGPLSCPRQWHFTLVSLDAEMRPEFCVSTRESCHGDSVGLSIFVVEEVVEQVVEGETFRDFRVVWAIQANRDVPLKRFRYGDIPEGWNEVHAPEPLQSDKTYSVGLYWFVLQRGDPPSWKVIPRQALPRAK